MKRAMSAVAAFVLAVTAVFGCIEPVTAYAYSNPVPVEDLRKGDFIKNRLTPTAEGFMRVTCGGEDTVYAEYYDRELNFISGRTIGLELPLWGGFYAGFDAYYMVEGQANEAELNDNEVIRVIKYDKDWNRLGAASITCDTGCEVRYPFDLGGCEMTEYNGELYFSTGHEGFVDDSVGQGHQGLLFIAVDEETMTPRVVDEDFWHSFTQYIEMDGSDLYMAQLSEGSRCTLVSRYDQGDLHTEGISWGFSRGEENVEVLQYGGSRTSAWAIATYATVDGLAVSDNNALCLGRSIDQSRYDEDDKGPYNIYLTVTPKTDFTESPTTLRWLTDIGEEQYISGANITKINDDRFMVSWDQTEQAQDYSYQDDINDPERESREHKEFLENLAENGYDSLDGHKLHYVFIDGNGEIVSDEFVENAAFSDCKPIVVGDKIVFSASSSTGVDFYTIDAWTGKLNKKVYNCLGEDILWTVDSDGVLRIEGTGAITSNTDSYSYTKNFNGISDHITKIIIGDGITSVPDEMFCYFSRLEEVHFGRGVKTIGESVLEGTQNDVKVYVPDNVESIGEHFCFSGWYTYDYQYELYYATICTTEGSAAEKFAQEHGMKVEHVSFDAAESENKKLYRGDVNSDGKVNAVDIAKVAAHIKGLKKLSDDERKRGDVNDDGKLNAGDITQIAAHIKGLRTLPEILQAESVGIVIDDEAVPDDETTSQLDMTSGDTVKLKAVVTPKDAEYTLSWSSSDSRVAEVSADGTVTAKAAGTADITAETNNGVTAKCTVKVAKPAPEEIAIDGLPEALTIADRGMALAMVSPANSSDIVEWSSSDEAVIRINETGRYEAVGLGTAVITASASGGAQASAEVTVYAADARQIELSDIIVNISSGDKVDLTAAVFPDIAESSIEWKSSDTGVATVENGKVTAVSEGLAIVTVTAPSGASASCRVNVDRTEPTNIWYLNKNFFDLYLDVPEGEEIEYELSPYYCDDKTVTFEVEDESIAKVTDGRIIPVSEGETILTATAVSGVSCWWYVHVYDTQPVPKE